MRKPKPTRIWVDEQAMLPLDEAHAPIAATASQAMEMVSELAEPDLPAAVAQYYTKQNEHEERENALPASLIRRRRIGDVFADMTVDYGDEE